MLNDYLPKIQTYSCWLKRRNLSINTIKSYTQSIKHFCDYLQDKEINTKNIKLFFKRNLKKYEASTLNLELQAISSYTKYLKIKVNLEKSANLIPKTQRKYFATISIQELNKIKEVRFEESEEIYQRNNLILDFLFYTGLRVDELVNIKHSDFKEKFLKVKGKGNKIRFVFFPTFFIIKINSNSQRYFFTTKTGKKISTRRIASIISQKAILAKISETITPHTFRRSFATLLHNKGAKLTTIQKLLGHSKLETTASYIHNGYDYLYEDYKKILHN